MGDFEQLVELLKIKLEGAKIVERFKNEENKNITFLLDEILVKISVNKYEGIILTHRKSYNPDVDWYKVEENTLSGYVNCKTYIDLFIK